jgi:WD40 repeat protein
VHKSTGSSSGLWEPLSSFAHIADILDNSVKVWDVQTGKAIVTYTGHTDSVERVAWSPDGTMIASASVDGTVQVWRPQV